LEEVHPENVNPQWAVPLVRQARTALL